MPISITQVFLDDSSVKTVTGKHTYDRENGGTLVIPSGSSLPTGDVEPGEWFWLTTDNKAYRRNDGDTAWVEQDVGISSSAAIMINESLGGQIVGAWPQQDVIFRETLQNSDETVFSYSNDSELTFLKAGTVRISATVSIEQVVGGGRTNAAIAIMRKPSGESYDFVDGTTRYLYVRNHEGGNFGSMSTSMSWQISANDVIKIVAWINGGNGTLVTVANACNINVIWMG